MLVGIASEWIGQRVGGPERYAVNLVRSLVGIDDRNEYRIIVTPGGEAELGELGPRTEVERTGSNSRWHYIPIGLPLSLMRRPVDVLHVTFTMAPWCPSELVVLTVHDVCSDVHPQYFPPLVRLRVRWLLERALGRATRVLVPSEASRRELLQHYTVDPEKIRVIPYGVDPTFVPATPAGSELEGFDAPSGDFVLYVGRFHGRKNLDRLVEAFSLVAPGRARGVRLVLVGRDFYDRERVLEKVKTMGLERDVLCPGHLSDASLEALYRRATVFAFPSLHEGFGFPPLEAMARGVPVLAGNVSVMPEILGDAALLVDPYSPEDIARGLDLLLGQPELRRSMIQKGRERVKLYDWQRTAKATLGVYEEVVNGGRR